MDDKIIISSILTDLTLKSKTTFIDAENNKELITLAKSKGIILPSPDLACIETVYCEIGKPNANGALLTKEAAKEGIETLIGKQINLNHKGKNYVIGYTIDAKIDWDKNLIKTTGILFKSLFQEEFEEIKQLFEEGKLFVSFELWNHLPNSEKLTYENVNGILKITKMIAHGVGLLLKGIKPACKKAQVFSLLANQKDIMKGETIFSNSEDFVFASLNSEEECKQCKVCSCEKEEKIVEEYLFELAEQQVIELTEEEINSFENEYEGSDFEEAKKLTYEQKKNLPDEDYAVVITVKNKKTGEPRKIRMFVINDESHVRNALSRLGQEKVQQTLKKLGVSIEEVKKKILKKAKELNMTELLKKYETAGADAEPAQVSNPTEQAQVAEPSAVSEPKKLVKSTYEYSEKVINTYTDDAGSGKQERTSHSKTTKEYSDGTKEEIESEGDSKTLYTLAELEEKVNAAKAEKDAEIATLKADAEKVKQDKDNEITSLKAEVEKEKNEKTSKDTEITNLKAELGTKTQELDTIKAKDNRTDDLNVGVVDVKGNTAEIADNIDNLAFGGKKNK